MAILAVSMFAACIVEEPEDKKPLVDDTPIDTSEDPKLPAKDYGGYNFTFLTQEGSAYNIKFLVSEGNSSEPLDDAIARRNALVEEKYNIKICQTKVADIDTEIRTQIMGEREFDSDILKAQKYILDSAISRSGNIYVQPHQAFNSDVAALTKAAETVKHLASYYANGKQGFDSQLPYYSM